MQAIEDFLKYLEKCLEMAKKNGKKYFISESTDLGLLVTLRSTLELAQYLLDRIKYEYVMTARFNQDAIEVRNSTK